MKHPEQVTRIQAALLDWFAANARDLPWRRTNDPYAVWVSEIMLQQTRVRAVVPYYERFLARFPTVERLARARLDTVLKLWEGLGYYSRARNLHEAAKMVVTRFHGHLPTTREELLTLPGIGRYTAGAIASIAFGRRDPLVDGNVTRVLCRVFRIRGNPKDVAVQKRIWTIAAELVPEEHAGQFNQALMELGSEVCLPRDPRCEACPVNSLCAARRHHEQDALPTRVPKRPLPFHTVVVGMIYRDGRILIDKRKPDGLLGGLWEFPGGKRRPGETLQAALRREVREELALTVRVGRLLAVVDHAYSHFRVRIHAFECTYVSGTPRCITCAVFKWVRPGDLGRYAFPAANNKIIAILRSRKPTH
ncbi:MAG: A/G-specific adenine glycosylase [Planctomycetes bacterium]|nr:A/G-specific adenine glycosylase [Planctomycetota bacterium]